MATSTNMADIAAAVEDGDLDAYALMLPIAALTTTQDNLEASVLDGMVGAIMLPPIFVVKSGGDLFVEDGHHRLATATTARSTHIRAVVCEKVNGTWFVA